MVKKQFNFLIKKGMRDNNMSLRELSRRAGMDVSFLSKILSGHRNPPNYDRDIINLAKILKINPDRLIIAAGRIPEGLENYFSSERIIDEISGLNKKPASENNKQENIKTPEKPARKKAEKSRTNFIIEDELL